MSSPSSEQPLPDKKPLLPKVPPRLTGLVVGGLFLVGGGIWAMQQVFHPSLPEATSAAVQPLTVETLTVQPTAIAQILEFSGTVRPLQQATLSTRVSGRITALPVEAGDRVQQGQVIARINVLDIAAQTHQAQASVAQAQANLAQAEAGVAQAQANLNQLQAQRLDAQAALKLARIEQARMAQLHSQGAVARQQLDLANTTLEQARARLAQVEANIQQAGATISRSQAAIAQSQAAVRQAEAGVTAANINQSYGTVVAPFDGIITEKLAYAGETTNPFSMDGTALVKLENPDRLQLEVPIPDQNRRFVRPGQVVQVRVDGVAPPLSGAIAQIIATADPNSRSFIVKIPLDKTPELMSGMFGRVELAAGAHPAIAIPPTAVFRRGQLEGVYLVGRNHRAEIRWVKTGKTQNGEVEIVSGLTAGDRIITSPLSQLEDGQLIATQP